LKILLFSDIHGDLKALDRLMAIDADLYIAAGDLSNFARGLENIGPKLAVKGTAMLVMPGNHESDRDIERFCERYRIRNIHNTVVEAAGYRIAGLGYSNITPFETPGEYTEAQIAERLQAWEGLNPLILVCHCPPKDTPLDESGPGKHFGSTAIRTFIEEQQPEYFFCGHIHEAAGVETRMGRTYGRNLGKQGYLLEICS